MADSSPFVEARRAAMLPPLLAAVRARRRRRRVGRPAIVVIVVACAAVWCWPAAQPPVPPVREPAVPSIVCDTIRTDPTTLARLTVPTRVRSEWFVDDDGLVGLLAAAKRPPGIVRAGRAVSVAATVVDPISDGVP